MRLLSEGTQANIFPELQQGAAPSSCTPHLAAPAQDQPSTAACERLSVADTALQWDICHHTIDIPSPREAPRLFELKNKKKYRIKTKIEKSQPQTWGHNCTLLPARRIGQWVLLLASGISATRIHKSTKSVVPIAQKEQKTPQNLTVKHQPVSHPWCKKLRIWSMASVLPWLPAELCMMGRGKEAGQSTGARLINLLN